MTRLQEINSYKFGVIEFRTEGLGVFFASEKLIARIEALSPDELRAANQAAWKVRRKADRLTERYCNVSIHGHGPYDAAAHDECVARAICNATWKALKRREAA